MATYVGFYVFPRDLVDGVHDFTNATGDTFKVALAVTNTPDKTTHDTLSDITEVAAGGGYTAGGNTSTMSVSLSSNVAKVTGTDPAVWTGTGGGFTFRWAVLYNDTSTEGPTDPLVAYWDYGSAQLVALGETLTVDFDGSAGIFTITGPA